MGSSAKRIVAVAGAGISATPQNLCDATEVGRLLALQGLVVATGGKTGVMEAASKGALLAGGITVGFLPGDNPDEANDYVQIPLALGIGYHRNSLLIQASTAVIAIGGSYGTMTEVTAALNFHKPVATIDTWRLTTQDGSAPATIHEATSPTDAIDWVLAAITS